MKNWTVPATVGAVLVSMAGAAHAQGQFPDINPDHWAFRSVQSLAEQGLVLGYPDGKFLGNRTLTRYEMATIVKRVVDNLTQRIQQVEGRIPSTPSTPATPTTPTTPATPTPGVTPQQLAEVRRLVEEFKTELTVIGTDLAALKTRMDALDQTVIDLEQRVNDTEDVNKAQQTALDTLNKKRIDGYIQARFARRATDDETRAREGVAQDVSRNYRNPANRDTFNVRRARINVRGDVTDRAAYRVQLDAGSSGGTDSVVVKEAYVAVKNILNRTPFQSVATADAWFGRSVTPFGFYLVYSSSDRLAPERYIAFSDNSAGLFPSQDYDTGAALRGQLFGRYNYHLGVYNGNGTASNDLGRRKDFIGQINTKLSQNWSVGISGYDGEGNTPLADPAAPATAGFQERRRVKSLIGVDTQLRFGPGQLNLEYVRGKGGLLGTAQTPVPSAMRPFVDAATVEGGYAELGYSLSNKFLLATAYEFFNRNSDPDGTFSGLSGSNASANGRSLDEADFKEERFHIGAHYFIDAATRLRLWYEAPLNYPNLPGRPESLPRTGQYTAEVQVKF